MSLSRREPHFSRQSRRHQSSQSCLPWRTTQLAAALSQVCRERAATSLAYRSSRPILLASASNCSARLSPTSAAWRSWPMSAIQAPCLNWPRFRRPPARSALRSLRSKSGERRISPPAFEALNGRVDALYIETDALISTHRIRINTLALAARLPTMHSVRAYVEAGGLMSYGPNYTDLFRRAGELVDKILRGTKPADIPVEQPTKFDLVINLTTAKALGLEVPPALLALADEVI